MPSVIKLNLPQPSPVLLAAVQQYADSKKFDGIKKNWINEFYQHKINSVDYYFDVVESASQLVEQQYRHVFPKHKVGCMIGIFKNTKDVPGCFPVHADRTRAVGINYFLTLGGNQVRSVFYDQVLPVTGEPKLLSYDDVCPVEEYISETNQWYCYDVERCHSVENIETTRVFLAIKLTRPGIAQDQNLEYNMSAFRSDYPHLFANN